MTSKYAQTWDLDVFFSGGSESSALKEELSYLKRHLPLMKEKILTINTKTEFPAQEEWVQAIDELQNLTKRFHELNSFISCLEAQNTKDEQAKILRNQANQLYAVYESVMTALESKLAQMTDPYWQQLINNSKIQSVSFALMEKRNQAFEKLPPEQEELVSDLSVDGYHAWEQMYYTIVGRMQIPYEENGKTVYLSVGQAVNKLAHPDRKVRQQVFEKWEEAWENHAHLFAETINHLSGYRLQLYKHRHWDHILKEPLAKNRMQEKTLNAMWEAVENGKSRLKEYLEQKAKILHVEKLSWYDLQASLPGKTKTYTYDEAADFIIEQFGQFSEDLAAFTQHAIKNRWIEAEDRPGKNPGGFCTGFPQSKQSRIFMTFSGTTSNLFTLAHELGHAYHSYVMKDLPVLVQDYAMNVAETASTFAELIVVDAAIKRANTKEEKLILLDEKLKSTVAFFMDIHSRFLFEKRFYEERKQGALSSSRLCELMTEAQKEGFANALAEYHPHFWASKLHFYGTDVPFYNFPYTFGYLFSAGIYARSQEEGPSFAEKYVHLLRDTGRMTVEELASRHLGVDLTKPDFWQEAVNLALKDVEEFLKLVK
ncbi:M3 family oligoendopeptidase [Thermoflavimicrobium dichotomicum]|uniref:Oligoendopeptidase, pepF/M3 family n=1 Tax=Thermoflavimicrobium dichotomicum TaxID=46223 RepID=A0A1I3U2Y6_9BACL|nr:M3 family oligoendopeptidase [Thermoflavimicrobium dichotomicum]SFJ76909.1 oligoendopeptidase, pepF/M3 family [Thermoflavimicrobium dichotomicum]